MSHRSRTMRASVAALGAAVALSAAALDPLEFVAGWPIDAPAGATVFDVPLSAEVYGAARSIEQIAVLDANGAPQAFFRRSLPATPPTEQGVVLEASPLYVGGNNGGGPRVGVTTDGSNTSVTVTPAAQPGAAIAGFVLDARAVETAAMAIDLDWRALPQPFLLDVTIEQSSDLTSWRSVGRGSIAALAIGESQARHARVPVRAAAGGYLRVTPSRAVADWYLLRATLVGSTTEPVTPPSVRVAPLAASAAPQGGPERALYFDANATLPVAAVGLAFGAGDGWVRADVAASSSLDGPWSTVVHGELFYSLSFEGRDFASEPAPVGRQPARFWRVVPAAPLRDERLELELEFPQEYLRVAANGGAPYLLAAGTLVDDAGPDATLASVWQRLTPPADVVPFASLGARRELGGPAALVAERVFPWRTATLWAVLLGGVLVVGAMAVRLAREMHGQS